MIVPALSIEAMTVTCFFFFLFFSIIWGTSNIFNTFIKVAMIAMSIWTGMNAVSIIWFNGLGI